MKTKRRIEVFGAGCPACEETIELVKSVACPSCEVTVLDMNVQAWPVEPRAWVFARYHRF